MAYGFCYTKYKKDGSVYRHCPGYASKKKRTPPKRSSTPLENRLLGSGFAKKVIKQVAAKMRASGKPMSDYSKTTGKLKTR